MGTNRHFIKPGTQERHAFNPDTQADLIAEKVAAGWQEDLNWPPVEPPINPLPGLALAELGHTDMVALRCFKAGIAFPAEWLAYTNDLRAIVNGTDTTSAALPAAPALPAGV